MIPAEWRHTKALTAVMLAAIAVSQAMCMPPLTKVVIAVLKPNGRFGWEAEWLLLQRGRSPADKNSKMWRDGAMADPSRKRQVAKKLPVGSFSSETP